ncbi:tRNA dimethylallyltransferase [Longispora fulva]|uniref:tRNA dimethylallyltransferase n=1 Tax=Longispora fulva TaxID=619741 RepID=A0A8J7GT09_9ACTN|nr:tRNA (adenosine(37)-N6)-dimethylallyltransferase MiaA [Longispora fulva]MBG6138074.1 tRNA dimethylallyltransferase [Longispora fulva]
MTNVIAVVGPTAAGKTALSIALARQLGAEVVNADSMQLYRGMDIGTAKVTADEAGDVPHHVLDIWDVTEPASVAEYQSLARFAIDSLLKAGRPAILVGGSGLYVRAVLDDFAFPGTDPTIRERLEAELAAEGSAALHARLPAEVGAKILASNGRRIVRALEVIELTGAFTAELPTEPVPHYPAVQLGVDLPPEVLDARIVARVDRMFDNGLVDEVRRLDALGLREGRTAGRALGYAQALRLIDGECDEATARADTVSATRKFVRRQRSWFRRDPRVHWLTSENLLAEALEVLSGAA